MRSSTYLLVLTLLLACSSRKERADSPLTRQFQAQIAASCADKTRTLEKVVREHADAPPETKVIALFDPNREDTLCYLQEEMQLAVEYFYDDAYLQEAFEVQQSGDTLIASLKPDQSRVDLRQQKVVMGKLGDSTIIRYLASQVRKKNWLYGLDLDLEIHFDSLGHYQDHHAQIQTRVILSGGNFDGIVDMKMLPES